MDRRKSLYKVINEIGAVLDFSVSRTRRDPAEIEADEKRILFEQAERLLKSAQKTIHKEAFELLVNKTGFQVGVFLSELEKVVVFLKDKPRIDPADVEEIVGRTKEDSVFDLQRAVGRRDLKTALFYLRELVGPEGASPGPPAGHLDGDPLSRGGQGVYGDGAEDEMEPADE